MSTSEPTFDAAAPRLWYQTSSVEPSSAAPASGRPAVDLIDLLDAVLRAADRDAAFASVAEQLQRLSGVQTVALGWCASAGRRCRLRALSGAADFDRQSPWIRSLEALLEETILRRQAEMRVPGAAAATAAQKHALLESGAGYVWSGPLRNLTGTPVGAWLILGQRGASLSAELAERLAAWEPLVARGLELVSQTRRGWRDQGAQTGRKRRTTILAILALVLSALLLARPMPYRVACDCVLQPVSRRYVAAPFDAKLKEALAEPGDLVETGQPLARLDGGELQMELAGLQADLNRAAKLHDTSLVGGDVASAQMAALEMERLRLRIALVDERVANLSVPSPLAGLVLSGDPKKTEGSPVTRGQILFEIAPLQKLVAEILIPDEDIRTVKPGQEVQIALDSQPDRKHTGRIGAIQPRAEIRDGRNVFVAEVALDNPEEILRPGMHGRAKVVTPPHPLAWNLFHKGIDYLASWMPW